MPYDDFNIQKSTFVSDIAVPAQAGQIIPTACENATTYHFNSNTFLTGVDLLAFSFFFCVTEHKILDSVFE